jgi:hypothetical protein
MTDETCGSGGLTRSTFAKKCDSVLTRLGPMKLVLTVDELLSCLVGIPGIVRDRKVELHLIHLSQDNSTSEELVLTSQTSTIWDVLNLVAFTVN